MIALIDPGNCTLESRRQMRKEVLLSEGESKIVVSEMFVRENDPSLLVFADIINRKVKQLHLTTMKLTTLYACEQCEQAKEEERWSLSNVSEVDDNNLLICEWKESMHLNFCSMRIQRVVQNFVKSIFHSIRINL